MVCSIMVTATMVLMTVPMRAVIRLAASILLTTGGSMVVVTTTKP